MKPPVPFTINKKTTQITISGKILEHSLIVSGDDAAKVQDVFNEHWEGPNDNDTNND